MRVLHFNSCTSGGGYQDPAVFCDVLAKKEIESRLLCKASLPAGERQLLFNRLIRRSFVSLSCEPWHGARRLLLSPGPENWEKIDVDLHTDADRFDFRALEKVMVKQGMTALQALDGHGGTNLGVKSKGFVGVGLLL
jgi:hypothetical protein